MPFSELIWLAAAAMAAGVVTGILAGLFGIGGGIVIVPVLFEIFRIFGVTEEVRMQLCVGTSLAIIAPTTVRSYWAHRAKGLVIPAIMRSWALPAVAGVAVGRHRSPCSRDGAQGGCADRQHERSQASWAAQLGIGRACRGALQ
jgi:uncharacterized membrane protein YfcA